MALLVLLCLAPLRAQTADFESYVFVNEDGSLKVGFATIHLYGIFIPPTETTCYTFERPIPCGPRAILALKFNIGTDFVACDSQGRNPDGSYAAICTAGDQDLAKTMLRQGWAVALPDAPYEYKVLEKIARVHGVGVWGIAVEPVPPRTK
jgi:endonuclease YncB( thermonuclease family)